MNRFQLTQPQWDKVFDYVWTLLWAILWFGLLTALIGIPWWITLPFIHYEISSWYVRDR